LKLGKNATQTFEMLSAAFGEQTMGKTEILQSFSRFKSVD
jgi:hypothetical protein